jgi:hypothetical protein
MAKTLPNALCRFVGILRRKAISRLLMSKYSYKQLKEYIQNLKRSTLRHKLKNK